jgi:hypothetical protein
MLVSQQRKKFSILGFVIVFAIRDYLQGGQNEILSRGVYNLRSAKCNNSGSHSTGSGSGAPSGHHLRNGKIVVLGKPTWTARSSMFVPNPVWAYVRETQLTKVIDG